MCEWGGKNVSNRYGRGKGCVGVAFFVWFAQVKTLVNYLPLVFIQAMLIHDKSSTSEQREMEGLL